MARGISLTPLAGHRAVELGNLLAILGASTYSILNQFKTGSAINTGAISATVIATNAVITAKIAANSVTTTKIGTSAVTTAKIANVKVTTAKLATSAVTNAKIAAAIISLGSATDGAAVGKLNAKYQVLTSATANTTVQVAHGLGRTPVGFVAVKTNKSSTIYDAGVAWTATNIFLKLSGTTVAATVWIF